MMGSGSMHGPDPLNRHPMAGFPQVCFPIKKMTAHLGAITSADVAALKA